MKKAPKNKAILTPEQVKELLTIQPVILDDEAKTESLKDIATRVAKAQTKKGLTEEERILRILKGEIVY